MFDSRTALAMTADDASEYICAMRTVLQLLMTAFHDDQHLQL